MLIGWPLTPQTLLAMLEQLPPELQVLEQQIGASGRTIG